MKTDPPISPDIPQPPRPERPRGKVFDVMRPGQAPASPTSRPVISSHKPQAQSTQATVSGIGEPEPRDNLGSHKMALKPMHDIDSAESTPGVGAHHNRSDPVPEEGFTPPAASASEAPTAENATRYSLPGLQSDETGSAPTSVVTAERSSPESVHVPETPDAPAPSEPAADPLEDVAMEPDAPAPETPEPETPKLPIPEVPDDDPVHDVAEPSLKGQIVVSHHSAISDGSGKLVFLIIIAVLFLIIVLDILMDVGIIPLSGVPHTNFF